MPFNELVINDAAIYFEINDALAFQQAGITISCKIVKRNTNFVAELGDL